MTKKRFNKICVIGLGYIGLPTAAMFASKNIEVVGVDLNSEVVDVINNGEIHIVEPGLHEVVSSAVSQGYLKAKLKPEKADAFIIAVPTPFKESDHNPDMFYVEQAARSISPVLKAGDVVILESTSPVGSTESLSDLLALERPDLRFPKCSEKESDIFISYCPERVLPGKIMHELVHNDRIVGGMTPQCSEYASHLYETFVEGKCIIASGPRVAEMTKLTENSFRDVNIAFANELSMICDEIDVDVWELIALANEHPRVNVLQPGPGVGGHCIAVDPWFIISRSPEHARLIKVARCVNDNKPDWVISKVNEAILSILKDNRCAAKTLNEITIACYGLTFKPNIDDIRESPSLKITKHLANDHPGRVIAVEPNLKSSPDSSFDLVEKDVADAIADVAVLLVDHVEFINASPKNVEYLIDTRGIW